MFLLFSLLYDGSRNTSSFLLVFTGIALYIGSFLISLVVIASSICDVAILLTIFTLLTVITLSNNASLLSAAILLDVVTRCYIRIIYIRCFCTWC